MQHTSAAHTNTFIRSTRIFCRFLFPFRLSMQSVYWFSCRPKLASLSQGERGQKSFKDISCIQYTWGRSTMLLVSASVVSEYASEAFWLRECEIRRAARSAVVFSRSQFRIPMSRLQTCTVMGLILPYPLRVSRTGFERGSSISIAWRDAKQKDAAGQKCEGA